MKAAWPSFCYVGHYLFYQGDFMKQAFLLFALTFALGQSYAQEIQEIGESEKEVITQHIDKEAESDKHDSKTKRLLKKISSAIKKSSQKVVLEIKKLDDCVNCESKSKQQVILTNTGRGLGKISAWVSTNTSKPFMGAAGFFTGLIEKKDKNADLVHLYKFFLNHSKEFDSLYLEAGTPESMIELMLDQMEVIVEKKTRIILKDFLASVGINRELPEDLSDFQLSDEEIASIDMDKVSPDFINNHPEYAELKPILGPVTQEDLTDLIMSGYIDTTIAFDNYKEALPKIHEGVATIVGQLFVPKVALGVISKSLAGLYLAPVIVADVATGISSAICLQKETQGKFEQDPDLKAFCSYVVNKSAYELIKSRAKGYVSGKKLREKIEGKLKARKERKAKKKANIG
jgi:hypothetical protein